MDLLLEYTKDIEELQAKIMKETNPEAKKYLEDQLDFTMELFAMKMDYRRDVMDLAKAEREDRLVQESKDRS